MKHTNWSTHPTFGGTPMVSRYTQQRVAASDHCVAIVRRCPVCFEVYVDRPGQPVHCLDPQRNVTMTLEEPVGA
jgi:hypothetical protein